MNKKLLFDLFSYYGYTNHEDDVIYFVKKFLSENGFQKGRDFTVDRYGNIVRMVCPGKPILCAHMDAVGNDIDRSLAKFIEIVNTKDGEHLIGRGNIGGDDKCGIYIILEYLTKVSKDINFILSTGEEYSTETGIPYIVQNLKDNDCFKSAPYCLVLDRNGYSDILCAGNSYGSAAFEEQLKEIGKKYGYAPSTGIYSDANVIRYFHNCANLSVGYYNAHTRYEYVSLDNLDNAFKYVCDIVKNITEPVEKVDFTYSDFKRHMRLRKLSEKNFPAFIHRIIRKLKYR